MELISAVYSKVRHRLNDDWAFANVTRCKAWDIQQDEMDLKEFIEKFNARRYTNAGVGIEFCKSIYIFYLLEKIIDIFLF